jgi:copper chaperone
MKTEEYKITGMSCGHCVMSLKKELGKVEGLNVLNVEIGSAKVEYDEAKVSEADIINAVEEAGFSLAE